MQLRAFEPALPQDRGLSLVDLAMELAVEAASFKASVRPELSRSLGVLVRSMNCYYSNLIEGHHTHPVDIERALAGAYDDIREKRNLQLEARAHIAVQELIDVGQAPSPVVSERFLRWGHAEFCQRLPEDLLWVDDPITGQRSDVIPGEFRTRHVRVGNHLAPAPESVHLLVAQFVEAYSQPGWSKAERIVAVSAAHHRLLWIHPFLDGNGRVARLFSHAMLRECGIGSELWSVARGLARSVSEYKAHLAEADEPRRGDLDGRGNLSDAALGRFCAYFLRVCIDQVRFMRGLLDPEALVTRVSFWVDEEVAAGRLARGSKDVLRHVVLEGSLPRSQAGKVSGYGERQARTIVSGLLNRGCLVSDGVRAPLRLGFPADVAERWLPLLYPPAPK